MATHSSSVRSRRKCHPPGIAGIALLTLATTTVLAGPGDLDPTFGASGRVLLSFPDNGNLNAAQGGTAILQQPDGKLLVGRKIYYWSTNEDFSVVRLTTGGSLDPTFSGDGRTSVDIAGATGSTLALLRQSDGKILAGGEVGGVAAAPLPTTRLALVRYREDGSPDVSFGSGGVSMHSLGVTHASIGALVQQPDGRIVAGGFVESDSGERDMLLARFNVDGSIDSTFGSSGSLIVDFAGARQVDAIRSVALQPDGKVVAQGYALDGSGAAKIAVLRVMPNGSLDATFGQGGLSAIDVSANTIAVGRAAHVLPDGKLILSARAPDSAAAETCSAIVARLNPDGSPDSTFGSGGLARISLGTCAGLAPNSAALEPSGAIVVAHTIGDVVVSRLTAAGQLDTGFGNEGSAIVDLSLADRGSNADTDFGVRLLRQSDGKFAVVASDAFDWDFGGAYFVVARLLANGSSPGLIGLRAPYVFVDEDATFATVSARRTGGSTGSLSVAYAVTGYPGSTDGVDFVSANGTLTWADGDAADKQIEIRILDDDQSDGSKWLRVDLSDPSGGVAVSSTIGGVRIEDNEAAAPSPAPPAPPPGTNPATSGDSGGGAGGLPLVLVLALALYARRRRAAG